MTTTKTEDLQQKKSPEDPFEALVILNQFKLM